jgi:hypothetical protein
MAPVAVAVKVGVVFVKPDRVGGALIQIARAIHEQLVAGIVLLKMLQQGRAFRRTVLRVRMVVVQTRSVAQNQVAVNGIRREPALSVLDEVIDFVAILHEFFDAKTSSVAMGILALVIPATPDAGGGRRSYQRDGFRDNVQALRVFTRNPYFSFGAELNIQSFLHIDGSVLEKA